MIIYLILFNSPVEQSAKNTVTAPWSLGLHEEHMISNLVLATRIMYSVNISELY